ncbi:hypothetical protein B0H17DRAFT_1130786 [Mycena rosella]|uniref:Uncharacterized protein n=1 Tax=Mycena rosella TaxID=1033263 RepID=A0AAD7GP07_MYCRO|nr:hypothetical protein B0H17DRAFT_1130786 [Mycena rosella]
MNISKLVQSAVPTVPEEEPIRRINGMWTLSQRKSLPKATVSCGRPTKFRSTSPDAGESGRKYPALGMRFQSRGRGNSALHLKVEKKRRHENEAAGKDRQS